MAKYYGNIGYAESKEIEPGLWVDEITERPYYGDLIRNSRRLQNSNQVNDNIVISNEISVIADPYAVQNFHNIRYAELNGTKWKVESAEVLYPRLTLTLGVVWNGEQA